MSFKRRNTKAIRSELVSGTLTLVLLVSLFGQTSPAFQVAASVNTSVLRPSEAITITASVNASGAIPEAVNNVTILVLNETGLFDSFTLYWNTSGQIVGDFDGMSGTVNNVTNWTAWGNNSTNFGYGYGIYGRLAFELNYTPNVSGNYTVRVLVNGEDIYGNLTTFSVVSGIENLSATSFFNPSFANSTIGFGALLNGSYNVSVADRVFSGNVNSSNNLSAIIYWNGTFSNDTQVPDGNYTVFVEYEDVFGNKDNESVWTYVDTAPPSVEIDYPDSPDPDRKRLKGAFTLNVTVNETGSPITGPDSVKYRFVNMTINDTNWTNFTDNSGNAYWTNASARNVPVGNFTIVVNATDEAGNSVNASVDVESAVAIFYNGVISSKLSAKAASGEYLEIVFDVELKGAEGIRFYMTDLDDGSGHVFDPYSDLLTTLSVLNTSNVSQSYYVKNDYDENESSLKPKDLDNSTLNIDTEARLRISELEGMSAGSYAASYGFGLYDPIS